MDEYLGAVPFEQALDRFAAGQIVLPAARNKDVAASSGAKLLHDVGAEEAGATGDCDALRSEIKH